MCTPLLLFALSYRNEVASRSLVARRRSRGLWHLAAAVVAGCDIVCTGEDVNLAFADSVELEEGIEKKASIVPALLVVKLTGVGVGIEEAARRRFAGRWHWSGR
jgi:hypothetical protein